ncbi:MAG: hypothetical protein AAB376_03815, partial [Pseudomonadota bacterium]
MSPIRNIDHTVPDDNVLPFSAPMMVSPILTASLIIGLASAQAMRTPRMHKKTYLNHRKYS